MKVLLIQDVPNLGHAGDVKEVADGYGRNYLIPRGLAVPATEGRVRMAEVQKRARAAQATRQAQRIAALAERLEQLTLTFQARAGPSGRLYGSITPADIAEALERELQVPFDRRKILTDPLRDLGDHTVPVRLSGNRIVSVRVRIEPEEAGRPARASV
ncbi:MAG: 50S ribosomal protein L9 [Anaerolineae bacterium]|nr:50S ribosomal protein L9 [Anaerolineae bacterium]MDW8067380.1 50S ribosomal protein L9 [Anaerolineae bacterium]